MLTHDGWQHAAAYHWLISQAAQGHFVVIMPAARDQDGDMLMYGRRYDESLWSLVNARPRMRAIGFAAFADIGHQIARQRA